ncbi:hypothetical protein V5799_019798 [Amblyomma americanum]|uniref:C2H2-type domain-containing protein n=1 Tax=Amblyomma americanum TaxID=6943 RepID=A0AAQ4EWL6_AMBAM
MNFLGTSTCKKLPQIAPAAPATEKAGGSMLVLSSVFTCEPCGELFLTQEHLDKHRQLRHPQKPPGKFCCTYCPYSSDDRSHVVMHERMHTGERPFVCQFCKKSYQRLFGLKHHLQKVHGAKGQQQCADCAQCFPSSATLFYHRRAVHLCQFKCPSCMRGFTHRSDLEAHMIKCPNKGHRSNVKRRNSVKRRTSVKPQTLVAVREEISGKQPPQVTPEPSAQPPAPSALTAAVVKVEPKWPL